MSRGSQGPDVGAGPLLAVEEAATYLGIAIWTLRHWVSQRKISFVRLGRLVRFRQADLDAFISKHVVKSNHGK